MFNQIITTISSFNSVITATDPTIKTQPKLEEKAAEFLDGETIIINKDDSIIKFISAKADGYGAPTVEDVKLKSFVTRKKEEANDAKKNSPSDVEIKELLKIFKEGDDTAVVLNLYQLSLPTKQDEKEFFTAIVTPKVDSINKEVTAINTLFHQLKGIDKTTIEASILKLGTVIKALTDAKQKDKIQACISSIEDLTKSIEALKVNATQNADAVATNTAINNLNITFSDESLNKALTAAKAAAAKAAAAETAAQGVIDAFLEPMKPGLKKTLDRILKEFKDSQTLFEQTLKGAELFKKLSDTKLAFGFEITFKETSDAKKTKVIWTNFFNIDDKKKLVEIPKEQIHFGESSGQSASDDDKPIYGKWWFWVIIGGGVLIVGGVTVYFVIGKDDSDTDE